MKKRNFYACSLCLLSVLALHAEEVQAFYDNNTVLVKFRSAFFDAEELKKTLDEGLHSLLTVNINYFQKRGFAAQMLGHSVVQAHSYDFTLSKNLFLNEYYVAERGELFPDFFRFFETLLAVHIPFDTSIEHDFVEIYIRYFPVRTVPPFNLLSALFPSLQKRSGWIQVVNHDIP